MKITVLCVGKTKAPFLDTEAHYLKMLKRHLRVEVKPARTDGELVERLPGPGVHLVALDESGKPRDSGRWARWLDERRMSGNDICFLVGGHDGLPGSALERVQETVSFGPQTLAHQLARVVLLEQLFRASKIAAGERYHY